MKLLADEYPESTPADMWGYIDSSPGPYARYNADGWTEIRNQQCIALRSDRTRCLQLVLDDAGFCDFHFERFLDWYAAQEGQRVAHAASLERPDLFRFRVDRSRLEDAMKLLEDAPAYVYFISVGDIVKVGYSRNVENRFTQIRQGSGLRPDGYNMKEAVLLGCIVGGTSVEREIHQLLASYRLEGEWFRLTPTVITAIDHLLYDGLAPRAIEKGLRDMYGAVDGPGSGRRRNQMGVAS